MKIFNLFPTPLYTNMIDVDRTKLVNFVKDKFIIPNHNNYFLQSKPILHNLEIFQDLKNIIEEQASEYWHTLGYNSSTMIVTQMWANLMKGSAFIDEHFHSNSLISGVFYLEVDSKLSGTTIFSDPNSTVKNIISVTVDKETEFTRTHFDLPVENNMLILFPSYLLHKSQKNQNNSSRITISFNLLPTELGSEKDFNYATLFGS